ncbi:hypothetical protein CEE45_16110 [Candidatus Heimdallarchaeota archaeon B3_Heim]|nr:MAG: hypothetical protein CEE45_16110 [Candidatus Heimdallarchaeota archaeon B3_Heim]
MWGNKLLMVRIKTIKQNGRKYYALVHTVRNGHRTSSRTKYLGQEIPDNIDIIIEDFHHDLFMEEFKSQLSTVKQKHQQMLKKTPKTAVEKYYEDFIVRFTYDSNRIEGSTLTHRETAQLLLENQAPNRPLNDILEAKSHQTLFEEMRRYVVTSGDLHFNLIFEWHHILFKNSRPDIAGELRTEQVRITGSDFIPPLPVELIPLLKEFLQWYHEAKETLHPVELAALVHYKFVCIHPYWDGNGRMSRMLMNFVLYKHKFPMYNFRNKERTKYYNALARADKNEDPYLFVKYLTHRYVKEA